MIETTKQIVQKVSYYIDIGTGSIVVQFLISGILGGLVFVKLQWNKIKAKYKAFKERKNAKE